MRCPLQVFKTAQYLFLKEFSTSNNRIKKYRNENLKKCEILPRFMVNLQKTAALLYKFWHDIKTSKLPNLPKAAKAASVCLICDNITASGSKFAADDWDRHMLPSFD